MGVDNVGQLGLGQHRANLVVKGSRQNPRVYLWRDGDGE